MSEILDPDQSEDRVATPEPATVSTQAGGLTLGPDSGDVDRAGDASGDGQSAAGAALAPETQTHTLAPAVDEEQAKSASDLAKKPSGEQGKRSGSRWLFEWVLVIGIGLLVAVLLRAFVVQAFYIPSGSMEPTLKPNDRILVNKLSYLFHPPREGNIVVFAKPPNVLLPSNIKDLVKRVIGLPGQTIWSSDGHVFVNGHRLSEPFLPSGTATHGIRRQTIPPHEYFVMGDNRSNSEDSRVFGPIPRSLIVGQVMVRFWPLSRFKFF
ncbi:MAG: signal peptidase I [Actinomycetota bacterium]|nr:signal peptidase I [Actinomycetota bacterium]